MLKNEAEWQDLSDFLAREVMGYITWSDGSNVWWRIAGRGTGLERKISNWHPHKNIEQAMLVLKTLLTNIGRYAEAELHMRISPRRCRVTIYNWVATDGVSAGFMRGQYADNEMQAICLAAKAWLDTQKKGKGRHV